ncbi:hypothetical protein COL922a_011605 [Colletotrichum nupharicola]|nr:hypothetical protein COL922a_011605 [Colletotrichum nupharicola]
MATYGTKKDAAWRIEEEEALQHLKRAWELGFNTFDTSNFYCNGISGEILGKFLKTVPHYALNNNLTPFVNCQNLYSLLYREEEREMMPLLKYLGLGSTTWSPLARGHLARPLSRAYETVRSTSDAYHDEGLLGAEWEKEVSRRVEQLAEKRGYNMAQIGLAWVLHKDAVAAPIVGVSKIERFEETLAALEIELSDEEINFHEEPYQPRSTASFV